MLENRAGVGAKLNQRVRSHRLSKFDRIHIANRDRIYDLPRASNWWSSKFSCAVLDCWQLTGIANFRSGCPQAVSFLTTDGAEITASPTHFRGPE